MILETDRLILRPWADEDLAPFAALNADPVVMRYFPAVLAAEESADLVARFKARRAEHGFAISAVERKADGAFIGIVGIQRVDYIALDYTPVIEVGWRLAKAFWGYGYASEAATAWMEYGYHTLRIPEIVAFTATTNLPSQRVMQRIGMTHSPADNFDHPRIPADHPLRAHVLYRKKAP